MKGVKDLRHLDEGFTLPSQVRSHQDQLSHLGNLVNLIVLSWTTQQEFVRYLMTGLLSASAPAATAVNRAQILYETYFSFPESTLCISKKPHQPPSLSCQSHPHFPDRLSSESFMSYLTSERRSKARCAVNERIKHV